MDSIIPNKLKEELEDVGRVYNSRSGMCVYPNAFSRLQTEIIKICNENRLLKEGKTNVFAELNEETAKSNAELLDKVTDLEKENAELKADYEVLSCSVGDFGELQDKLEEEQRKNNVLSDNLVKAKEIISKFVEWANWQGSKCPSFKSIQDKAEQFLSEVEE